MNKSDFIICRDENSQVESEVIVCLKNGEEYTGRLEGLDNAGGGLIFIWIKDNAGRRLVFTSGEIYEIVRR